MTHGYNCSSYSNNWIRIQRPLACEAKLIGLEKSHGKSFFMSVSMWNSIQFLCVYVIHTTCAITLCASENWSLTGRVGQYQGSGSSPSQAPPMLMFICWSSDKSHKEICFPYRTSSVRQHHNLYIKGWFLSLPQLALIQQCGANWKVIM